MIEELKAIEQYNTWQLVKFPAHTKVVEVNQVFKLKHNADRSITRHKNRLIARGFLSRKGAPSYGIRNCMLEYTTESPLNFIYSQRKGKTSIKPGGKSYVG